MNLQPLYVVLGALLRSVLGWAKASLKDGKIDQYEMKELAVCIIRVGFIGVLVAYFPGTDFSWLEATIVALLADVVLSALKKVADAIASLTKQKKK